MAIVDVSLPIVPITAEVIVPLGRDGSLLTINGSQTGGPFTDALVGTTGNDVLDGGGGPDILTGTVGDDAYVVDNPGDLVVELPLGGTDTVFSSIDYALPDNVENLVLRGTAPLTGTGNASANIIIGNTGPDTLIGAGGDDIYGVHNSGTLVQELAGGGDDTVYADVSFSLPENVENLVFQTSTDVLGAGNAGDNTIVGGSGNDSLGGAAGNDSLSGANGTDQLSGGGGNDILDGGAGADVAVFIGASTNYTISQPGGPGTAIVVTDNVSGRDGTDTLVGVEAVLFSDGLFVTGEPTPSNDDLTRGDSDDVVGGSNGDDTIRAGGGDDTVEGGGGNDNLSGGSGDDSLSGGSGNDGLSGGSGNDSLSGADGNDDLSGGDGSDQLSGGAGDDTLDGGAAADVAVFTGASTDYTISQPGGPGTTVLVFDNVSGRDGTDSLRAVEFLQFADRMMTSFGPTPFDDDLVYGDADDVIDALPGDDLIQASGGDDRVDGGYGKDTLFGQDGDDEVHGNEGDDRLEGESGHDRVGGGHGNDRLAGGAGEDRLFGGTGEDTLYGDDGNDELSGENGQDVLDGGAGEDRVFGNDGNDVLRGNNGRDRLVGDDGKDRLEGGDGEDRLEGGANDDLLVGGSGSDTFVFDANFRSDRIEDFGADDVIEFCNVSFSGFAAVMAHVSVSGTNTLIDLGGGNILTLQNFSAASLQADDFQFV